MKVAVFGDSYADENIVKSKFNYKSWVEILREKYYPDLTCYGTSASSLYFSYDLFLEHQNKFDKIIFIYTGAGRITIPKYIKFKEDPRNSIEHINKHTNSHIMYHVANIATAEDHLLDHHNLMTEEGALATKAAVEYFKYLYDFEYELKMHNLMKDSIKAIRNDVVGIDITPHGQPKHGQPKPLGLFDISMYESPISIDKSDWMKKYIDCRTCHLSPRNNEILADKIFEWCNGKPVHIDLNDFEKPTEEEFLKHVRPMA